jgi:hypothetical protein
MRPGAAVSQQITGSFQIPGSCRGIGHGVRRAPALNFQIPGKMCGIHARWTWYRHLRVCFPRDSGKGKAGRRNWLYIHIYAADAEEVQMHIGSAILVIWLIIGGFAAAQRGDYGGPASCSRAATAAMTILAGPLNYTGVNPHVNCTVQSN